MEFRIIIPQSHQSTLKRKVSIVILKSRLGETKKSNYNWDYSPIWLCKLVSINFNEPQTSRTVGVGVQQFIYCQYLKSRFWLLFAHDVIKLDR